MEINNKGICIFIYLYSILDFYFSFPKTHRSGNPLSPLGLSKKSKKIFEGAVTLTPVCLFKNSKFFEGAVTLSPQKLKFLVRSGNPGYQSGVCVLSLRAPPFFLYESII